MLGKIKRIIKENMIPKNVEVDYENFMSEMQANVDIQDKLMGKPVKYGNKFQLVQESSKRFLSIQPADTDTVVDSFNNGYIDTQCYEFCFSEYPTNYTHFFFEECSLFQKDGEASIKDNHFLHLCALSKGDLLYLYNSKKMLFLTQSYKSPMSYTLVRESDTFDEPDNVANSEVVLLTYANDSYYLNVPQQLDKQTGILKESNTLFQYWEDYKDIDFNGWFMIEYDNNENKVYLKHFNTGKYLTVINGSGINDEAILQTEKTKEAEIVFEPLNSEEKDVEQYTSNVVFKIRSSFTGNNEDRENYLRLADDEDLSMMKSEEAAEQNILSSKSKETVPLVVKTPCPVNKYDTFNLVFPTDDKYRELIFSKDMHSFLQNYLVSLRESDNYLDKIKSTLTGIHDILYRIYLFLTNQLEGRICSDFDVGEIIPYRQKMMIKVGISLWIYEFLSLITQTKTEVEEENWSIHIYQVFSLPKDYELKFHNTLDLIFETIYSMVYNNSISQIQASKYVKTLQKYLFVDKISSVIIAIFKDKEFESNDKEIHKETLYKRIYEYERLGPLVKSFIKMLKKHQERKYMYILTKLWVIDNNPLPLIQNDIFELLFNTTNLDLIYGISFDRDNQITLIGYRNKDPNDYYEIDGAQFSEIEGEDEGKYILDQLNLEANLCHGRNKYLSYFKERYPVEQLIANITDETLPKKLRGMLIKILTNLYIDDHPYTLTKMSRWFEAYNIHNETEIHSNERPTNEFDEKLLEKMLSYFNSYFYAFAQMARGTSSVKEFEVQLIRCCKFMLKLGMFTERDGSYKINYIYDLFGFLCFILDIFTNRNDFITLESLDSIGQKDAVIEDYTQNNPIQKSAFDIKYSLLNKKDWVNSLTNELNNGNETSITPSFTSKIFGEIIEIFHFLMDLRQNYLMKNIIKMFKDSVCWNYAGYNLNSSEEIRKKAIINMIKSFSKFIPDSNNFLQLIPNPFPSFDQMYENERYAEYRKTMTSIENNVDMHDEFLILMIDTFNVSLNNNLLKQMSLTLICRYYSERAEFIRNINKIMVIFNKNEWDFYTWANYTIDEFTRTVEKSVLWINDMDQINSEVYIDMANKYLYDLR